jgi:glycosyltransferase involved in cell wall biosynthesis
VHSIGATAKHSLGLRLGSRVRRFVMAARLARRLAADVVHLHDPELIPLGLWLKTTTRSAVVFDCHENNTGYIQQKKYLQPVLRAALLSGMAFLERLAARYLDAVVTADAGVADLYRRRYGARRVVIVHNFPRLDLFEVEASAVESKQAAQSMGSTVGPHAARSTVRTAGATAVADPPVVRATVAGPKRDGKVYDLVYHGTIPRYHLEISFAVAAELRRRGVRARWLFFGKCPEIAWAKSELQRRGLEADFDIDPTFTPHAEVAQRVQQARIGFIPLPDLPKFQHNIPTKLFEFMVLGMPTVLSDLPPSRPFVGDGTCAVLVAANDPAAYAKAIHRLLADPALALRMGEAARRRARERFHWGSEARALLSLYDVLATEVAV